MVCMCVLCVCCVLCVLCVVCVCVLCVLCVYCVLHVTAASAVYREFVCIGCVWSAHPKFDVLGRRHDCWHTHSEAHRGCSCVSH